MRDGIVATKDSFQESAGSVLIPILMTNDSTSKQSTPRDNSDNLALSVIVPVHNEEENIVGLAKEISDILLPFVPHEIIYVNDGSTDNSYQVLLDLTGSLTGFRALQHFSRKGQSAAIYSGVTAAKAPLIVTLDGDGQNDPADIPTLLETYYSHSKGDGRLMVAGWRKGRSDSWSKRVSSRIANAIRSSLLSDHTPDTGCGLKIFRREDFMCFPAFNHMHRFMPALMLRNGGRVKSVEVNHRPRIHGKSHYGILNRLWIGFADLLGVSWLNRRKIHVELIEICNSSDKPRSP